MGLRDTRQHRAAQKRRDEATAATGQAVADLSDAVGRLTTSTSRYLGLATSRAVDDLGANPAVGKALAGVGAASAKAGKAAKTAKRKTSRWLTIGSVLGFVALARKVREQPVPPDVEDPGPDPEEVEGRS